MKFKTLLVLSCAAFLVGCGTTPTTSGDPGKTPPSGGPTSSEAAKMIRELDLNVDPAKYILGERETAEVRRNMKPRSVDGESETEKYSKRRPVDRLGGTYEEKEGYCSYTSLGDVDGDVAERIVNTCNGFSGSLETITMLKKYVPDDLEFGKAKECQIHMEEYGETYDIPMSFYLNKNGEDIDFAFKMDYMGMKSTAGIYIRQLEGGKTQYQLKTYNVSQYYYYMSLGLYSMEDIYNPSYDFCWDIESQEYYSYDVDNLIHQVQLTNQSYQFNVSIASDSTNLLEFDSNTKILSKKISGSIDLYIKDNNDGTLTARATLHDENKHMPEAIGAYQRVEPIDVCSVSTWIDGESYERVSLPNAPVYAFGDSASAFFKAYKDEEGYWRVYRSYGFGGNECLAIQDAKGWIMCYDYNRERSTGDVHIGSAKIASLEAHEIVEYSGGRSATITLNAFNGFDEIRSEKQYVYLRSPGTINGQNVDYYYYSHRADIYNNNQLVFANNGYYGATECSQYQNVQMEVAYGNYSMTKYENNFQTYAARIYFGVNGGNEKPYTPDYLDNFFKEKNLTLKYNDGDLKYYLTKSDYIFAHADEFLAEFDFYGIVDKMTISEYVNKCVNTIYPKIDCVSELNSLFN